MMKSMLSLMILSVLSACAPFSPQEAMLLERNYQTVRVFVEDCQRQRLIPPQTYEAALALDRVIQAEWINLQGGWLTRADLAEGLNCALQITADLVMLQSGLQPQPQIERKKNDGSLDSRRRYHSPPVEP